MAEGRKYFGKTDEGPGNVLHGLAFGPYMVIPDQHLLLKDRIIVQLTPTPFQILLEFLRHPGVVLSKDYLMKAVWPGERFVEDGTLTRHISTLRQAIGDEFFKTIPRVGWRFVSAVTECRISESRLSLVPDQGTIAPIIPEAPQQDLLPSLFIAGSPASAAPPKKAMVRAGGYSAAGAMALVGIAIYVLFLRHGPLADFYVQGRNVVALDDKGRELWRHRFPLALSEQTYLGNERPLLSWIGDLDGGGSELILATKFYRYADVGSSTFCFRANGSVKWTVQAGGTVDDVSGSHMTPPYYINSVQVLAGKTTADTRIVIGSAHHLEQPYQVAFLDINGRVVGEYWHPGQLLHVNQADLDGDGREELLLAGVNNGDHQATLVVLDPLKVVGAVTPLEMQDRSFALLNMAAAKEKAVVLFPRSCLSVGEPYTRVEILSVSDDRITVVVAEGPAEREYPGFIYELDRNLRVVGVQPQGPGTFRRHDELEARGKLDHPFDAARECARLKAGVIIRRGE